MDTLLVASTYDYSDAASAAVFLVAIVVYLLFAFAGYIISSFFYMKIFEKAGVEGKWRAWVPIYREMIFGKLGDVNPWALLIAYGAAIVLSFVPVINFLLGLAVLAGLVLAAYRVSLKFGKNPLLILLWLIPGIGLLIWLGILAFGSARWQPVVGPAPWAGNVLADKTVWQGVPVQPSAVGTAVRDDFAPGAYPPPPGGYAPPPAAGYQPPPPGYQPPPPPGYSAPPPGYSAPPPPPSNEPPAPEQPRS